MKLLFNNDGSINYLEVDESINKGSSGVNDIYVAVKGRENDSYTCSLIFELPNGDVNELSTTASPVSVIEGVFNGFKATLTAAQTIYTGVLKMSVELLDLNDNVLMTYEHKFFINPTPRLPDETMITEAQFQQFLQSLNSYQTKYSANNVRKYASFEDALADEENLSNGQLVIYGNDGQNKMLWAIKVGDVLVSGKVIATEDWVNQQSSVVTREWIEETFELLANKKDNIENSTITFPSSRALFTAYHDLLEKIDGKSGNIVISSLDTITLVKQNLTDYSYLKAYDLEGVDITQDIIDGTYDDYDVINGSFSSQSDVLYIDEVSHPNAYIIIRSKSVDLGVTSNGCYTICRLDDLLGKFGLGFSIFVVEREPIPDRWYGGRNVTGYDFYALDTKTDTSNFAKLNQSNTFTQKQVFGSEVIFGNESTKYVKAVLDQVGNRLLFYDLNSSVNPSFEIANNGCRVHVPFASGTIYPATTNRTLGISTNHYEITYTNKLVGTDNQEVEVNKQTLVFALTDNSFETYDMVGKKR